MEAAVQAVLTLIMSMEIAGSVMPVRAEAVVVEAAGIPLRPSALEALEEAEAARVPQARSKQIPDIRVQSAAPEAMAAEAAQAEAVQVILEIMIIRVNGCTALPAVGLHDMEVRAAAVG